MSRFPYDANEVKGAAFKRWIEIFPAVGISIEYLNSKEGPCPKCGGNTRWRVLDIERGATYCSHCRTKNGDGIATVMWWTGAKFPAALKMIADIVGIKPKEKPPKAIDADLSRLPPGSPEAEVALSYACKTYNTTPKDHGLVSQGDRTRDQRNCRPKPLAWNPEKLKWVCKEYSTTPRVLEMFGARLTMHCNVECLAFPLWNWSPEESKPIDTGWLMQAITPELLPHGRGGKRIKRKLRKNDKSGLLLPVGCNNREQANVYAQCREIWKLEGLSDVLAFMALEDRPPDVIALTSGAGAGERCHDWYKKQFEKKVVRVVGDADQPGREGATYWASQLQGATDDVRLVQLPFPETPTKGKDIRDYIAEGNTYTDLKQLAENGIPASELQVKDPRSMKPASLSTPSQTRPTVKINDVSQAEIFANIKGIMLRAGLYYSRGSSSDPALWLIEPDHKKQLDATQFRAEFGRYADAVREIPSKDGPIDMKIPDLPETTAKLFLLRHDLKKQFPFIALLTNNPGFDHEWNLYQPGYNEQSQIYYQGTSIDPANSIEHLSRLLDEFCWRDSIDRINYIGILLTGLVMHRFIGSHPMLLLNGNQPGVGKTTLARIASIIRDGGSDVGTVSFIEDEIEFEKQIAARINNGDSTCIIDNAKSRRIIQSASLERSISDKLLQFRLLGTSNRICVENAVQFILTVNTAEVDTDLATRSLVVNLEYHGDPRFRKYKINNLEEYAAKHRDAINAELIGMFKRWVDAGKPLADVNCRFNQDNWGRIIGGVLAVNGMDGFHSNQQEVANEIDMPRHGMNSLVDVLVNDHFEHPLSCADLVQIIQENCSELHPILGKGNDKSRATKLGKFLTRYDGQSFGDFVFTGVLDNHTKSKRYMVIGKLGGHAREATTGIEMATDDDIFSPTQADYTQESISVFTVATADDIGSPSTPVDEPEAAATSTEDLNLEMNNGFQVVTKSELSGLTTHLANHLLPTESGYVVSLDWAMQQAQVCCPELPTDPDQFRDKLLESSKEAVVTASGVFRWRKMARDEWNLSAAAVQK